MTILHVVDAGNQVVLDKSEFQKLTSLINDIEIRNVNRKDFFGKVHLGVDPIEFQKKARNEWN